MKIAWMYPDTLFLHGDRGNILALERYAKELGADARVDKIDFETADFDPVEYDVIFFGPGEISSFEAITADMQSYMDGLKAFVESGRSLVVTGTTMAMFGQKTERTDGSIAGCAGLIPVSAVERDYVYGDDLYIETDYHGKHMEVVGNQIQMANIELGEDSGAAGFGKVIYGMGNNGRDGIEGAMYKNSIFTNLVGPVLACNPWLTCEIIRAAAEVSGEKLSDKNPDFDLELKSIEKKKTFIANKKPGSMGM